MKITKEQQKKMQEVRKRKKNHLAYIKSLIAMEAKDNVIAEAVKNMFS
jgi:two-component sensor histidine kinase